MPVYHVLPCSQTAELLALPGEGESANPSHIIAEAARVCKNKSHFGDVDLEADRELCRKLMGWGHWSPFEFFDLTFQCVTSRAVTHELVRHRLASYAQESQRYCDYKECLSFICPAHIHDKKQCQVLFDAVSAAHKQYCALLDLGVKPEDARVILPNCTATRIQIKMNLREFRHFLDLRTSKAAWSEMQKLARAMADAFLAEFPDDSFLIGDVCHA